MWRSASTTTMILGDRRPTCPRCQGRLFVEYDVGGPIGPAGDVCLEWNCLQCGWRRSQTAPAAARARAARPIEPLPGRALASQAAQRAAPGRAASV